VCHHYLVVTRSFKIIILEGILENWDPFTKIMGILLVVGMVYMSYIMDHPNHHNSPADMKIFYLFSGLIIMGIAVIKILAGTTKIFGVELIEFDKKNDPIVFWLIVVGIFILGFWGFLVGLGVLKI